MHDDITTTYPEMVCEWFADNGATVRIYQYLCPICDDVCDVAAPDVIALIADSGLCESCADVASLVLELDAEAAEHAAMQAAWDEDDARSDCDRVALRSTYRC